MTIHKRRPVKSGIERAPKRDFPSHRKWVRGHNCAVPGCDGRPIEAAHVRLGLPQGEQAGMSQKPHDKWCISLCAYHHAAQHAIGEATFSKLYTVDLVKTAMEFATKSPHRHMWEGQRTEAEAIEDLERQEDEIEPDR